MPRRDTDKISKAKERVSRMDETDFQRNLGDVHYEVLNNGDKPIQQIPISKLYAAPLEWNFWPPMSEGKMLETMMSIQENGLWNPVILWKKGDGFMILSGHNRTEAYRRIIVEYGDVEGFNREDYLAIPSIVFEEDEIDEKKAREIITDTNYLQREEDKRLMPIIVKNRMEITKDRKDQKGRTIDIVAKALGLSRTKVYEDYIIGENIITEISDLFFDGLITKKSLLRFPWYGKGVQQYLYDNHKKNITNENCMKIKRNMTRKQLDAIFSNKAEEKIITMQVRVPESLRDEFREMCNVWLKERGPQS